jgi:precorrin-2 dehydrogenase/sirohydrochlorin ferrochelatase
MLVNLKSNGKYVVVVGGGSEGYRKTLDFVEAGAKVLVVSRSFSNGIKQLSESGKICIQKEEVEEAEVFISSFDLKPDLLVAVTNNHELNQQLITKAKQAGCMVYAPDNPAISDFTLPAVAKVGDVKIAISTEGKSPAMARVLRQRIEKLITPEDLLQVELQNRLRKALKEQVADQKARRQLLYRVLEDAEVKKLLKKGALSEAQEKAEKILQASAKHKPKKLTKKWIMR